MAKVLLALLAMYAVKNVQRAPSGQPVRPAAGATGGGGYPGAGGLDDLLKGPLGQILGGGGANPGAGFPRGGLGDLLKGPLGGLLGGAGAGALLNGGLDNLLKQFQHSGHGALADSWVGRDANKPIARATSPRRSAPTRSTRSPTRAACGATTRLRPEPLPAALRRSAHAAGTAADRPGMGADAVGFDRSEACN